MRFASAMGNSRNSRLQSTESAGPVSGVLHNGTVGPSTGDDGGNGQQSDELGAVVQVASPPSQAVPDRTTTGGDSFDVLRTVVEAGRIPWGRQDDPAATRWKKLWDWLTSMTLPSGKRREVARLAVIATPIGFSATLSDFTISYKLCVEFDNLEDLWATLEEGLHGRTGKWVELKQGEGYHKRKEDEKKALEGKKSQV